MSATGIPDTAAEISASAERTLSTREWVGFIAMVFGIFMAILDIQIVASSLEQIQAGLSATRDEITWVQTAYLIAEVVIIPLSGWLARALSTRILFAVSCAGFTLMSLLCALAWNLDSMIVFRGLQGLFGGAMIPSVFAVIYTLFPPRLQPTMVIVVGLVVTVAPTAGPVFGGYLTDAVSWKALFLVNLVPGLLVTVLTWLLVRVEEPVEIRRVPTAPLHPLPGLMAATSALPCVRGLALWEDGRAEDLAILLDLRWLPGLGAGLCPVG